LVQRAQEQGKIPILEEGGFHRRVDLEALANQREDRGGLKVDLRGPVNQLVERLEDLKVDREDPEGPHPLEELPEDLKVDLVERESLRLEDPEGLHPLEELLVDLKVDLVERESLRLEDPEGPHPLEEQLVVLEERESLRLEDLEGLHPLEELLVDLVERGSLRLEDQRWSQTHRLEGLEKVFLQTEEGLVGHLVDLWLLEDLVDQLQEDLEVLHPLEVLPEDPQAKVQWVHHMEHQKGILVQGKVQGDLSQHL